MSDFWIKHGHMLHNREFTVILLRTIWNAAKKNPRFKQILDRARRSSPITLKERLL